MSLFGGSSTTPFRFFDHYHPAVQVLFFASVLLFSMCALQPIYVILSLTCACIYAIYLKGLRTFLHDSWFFAIIIIVIAVINPLFGSQGNTVLFMFMEREFTAESFIYGLCSGAMLVSVFIWFSCSNEVVTTDGFLSLFGNLFPTIALVVSMVFSFIPRTIEKAHVIMRAQTIVLGEGTGRAQHARRGIRMASVLMAWSMEDAVETADSMRARGYGASSRRSSYRLLSLTRRDGAALTVLIALIIGNMFLVIVALGQFSFYPQMSTLYLLWWGYLPYVALLLFPLLLEGWRNLRWMH